jgi:hypothetical protein
MIEKGCEEWRAQSSVVHFCAGCKRGPAYIGPFLDKPVASPYNQRGFGRAGEEIGCD